MSPARAPGFDVSRVVMAMTQGATVKVIVNAGLADEFEAHAHLLAPATLVAKAQTAPFWCTYHLHCPTAPHGAASVVPCFSRTEHGVQLHCMEWYDVDGRPLPAPPTTTPPTDAPSAHATAQ